ncbi:mitochondrial carrier domain-containing protein [Powellomyces hirtus]|nr:mitochondrial carrier domain-containing protein [Powellomyces hirtus]
MAPLSATSEGATALPKPILVGDGAGISPERYVGFFAGLASGATKLIVGHPFDTVKVRLQTDASSARFNGAIDCLRTTVRREGLRALYKGATPPLMGWALMDAVQMGTLNNLRYLLSDGGKKKLSVPQHALAGLGAGIVVSFVANPVEVLKGRLQVQYDKGKTLYKGPVDCAKQLIRNNGIRGLYKGLSACLLFRSFFWVLWGSYEIYTQLLTSSSYVPSNMIPFLAGGAAANTFWTISFPADVLKQRMMTQPDTYPRKYPTLLSCIQQTWRTEGVRGFYRGFVPCFLRSFPTNGAAIFVFETAMRVGRDFVQ